MGFMSYREPVLILDRDANVVSRSRNLRGLRAYCGKHIVDKIEIFDVRGESRHDGDGLLVVSFQNGAQCRTLFASYSVLASSLRTWRNLYGAALFVDNNEAGKVEYKNETLVAIERREF